MSSTEDAHQRIYSKFTIARLLTSREIEAILKSHFVYFRLKSVHLENQLRPSTRRASFLSALLSQPPYTSSFRTPSYHLNILSNSLSPISHALFIRLSYSFPVKL